MDIVKFGRNQDVILNRLQLKNISVLEAYDKSIEKIKEYYQYQVIKGAYRTKEDLIPEKAYREAIANALVHREWMIDSYIQVSMEDEFIVITSPGGLTEGVAEEEYLEGQRSLMRNPIIGNVFFRLDIIESFGTGIRRIKKPIKIATRSQSLECMVILLRLNCRWFQISMNYLLIRRKSI